MALYAERNGKRIRIPREKMAEGMDAVNDYIAEQLPEAAPKAPKATKTKTPPPSEE